MSESIMLSIMYSQKRIIYHTAVQHLDLKIPPNFTFSLTSLDSFEVLKRPENTTKPHGRKKIIEKHEFMPSSSAHTSPTFTNVYRIMTSHAC